MKTLSVLWVLKCKLFKELMMKNNSKKSLMNWVIFLLKILKLSKIKSKLLEKLRKKIKNLEKTKLNLTKKWFKLNFRLWDLLEMPETNKVKTNSKKFLKKMLFKSKI
jgi:hypothetical protein